MLSTEFISELRAVGVKQSLQGATNHKRLRTTTLTIRSQDQTINNARIQIRFSERVGIPGVEGSFTL